MSGASGLGLLDVAILEACDLAGAQAGRPYVTTQRVLDVLAEITGVGPRHAYEPRLDLARRWVVHLPLIDFHGNAGSPDFAPASPPYTGCRLTPLGAAVLDAERGAIGPLPIGLINGNSHAGGLRPPLAPGSVLRAIRQADTATDDELTAIVGLPVFPTGCLVDGDPDAFAAGTATELHLSACITPHGSDRLVISHLPPQSAPSEIAQRIVSRLSSPSGLTESRPTIDDRPGAALITEVDDRTTTPGDTRLVITLAAGADSASVITFLDDIWGVRSTLSVRLAQPLAAAIRAAAVPTDHSLESRLDVIESSLAG